MTAIEDQQQTDNDLFDNAVSTETPAAERAAAVEAPAAPAEQPATPAAEAQAATPADGPPTDRPPVDDDAPLVPSWRVREINEERRAAQAERDVLRAERDRFAFQQQEMLRQLAQLQQPAAAKAEPEPDPIIDPKGYRDFIERRFEERLVAERREHSLQFARRIYGQEFDQAYSAARQLVDPVLRARMQQSSDPGETLIGWFREKVREATVGNDLNAYNKKLKDEALKEALENPEFRKAAMDHWSKSAASAVGGRPNVSLPPSLNGISRSNAQLRAAVQEDMPDDALWDQTMT
jgi:hypothetical protein